MLKPSSPNVFSKRKSFSVKNGDHENENKSEKFYSALGTFPDDDNFEIEHIAERVRFRNSTSLHSKNYSRPFKDSNDIPLPSSSCYKNEEIIEIPLTNFQIENETEEERRSSKELSRIKNIFDYLDEWKTEEILSSFTSFSKSPSLTLSELEIRLLNAAWNGEVDTIHEILSNFKGKTVRTLANCMDSKGRTPLHFAAAFDHSQAVQVIIQWGGLVNVWDRSGKATPLICACACGSLPVVEILIGNKAEVNAGLSKTQTPLHWAIRNGSVECVKKLLEEGAVQNTYENEIGSPLHLATSLSDSKCMKLLLDYGADINLGKGKELFLPLHIAANEGNIECMEVLIGAGANVECLDSKEQTPLHIAAMNGDYETTEYLLSLHKANANAVDCDKRTPLHKSVKKGNDSEESLLLLLEFGGNINAQDKYGYTPLHLAAMNESSYLATFLLKHGADITIRTKSGQSVLSLLVKKMPHVIRHIKEALDNAISINRNDPNDPDCELKLDFRAMISATPLKIPHSKNSERLHVSNTNLDYAAQRGRGDEELRETGFLTCLIKTGHKSFLSHPLIESFIVLKWQRVRVFFWISLLFYFLMVLLYSFYVHKVYVEKCQYYHSLDSNGTESLETIKSREICELNSNSSEKYKGPVYCDLTNNVGLKIVWFLLSLISVFLTLKEIFQMIQGFKAYWMVIEHYLQWILLGSIFLAVWPVPMTGLCLHYWHYPSAAIGIFVAWSLMLVRIGRFPALGIYVQMLANVIKNFGLFISAYACLLIAFALAFCVLFPDEAAFSSVSGSFLKILTMLIGELNFDDLFYEKIKIDDEEVIKELYYPITSYILFAGFVIFVTIIMMNLLVGLAVHDIQKLEKDAKLERLLRQTSSIAGLEMFLFSKGLHAILPSSLGSFLRKRALLVPSSYKWIFYFRPNDPRDRTLPKELGREALILASSRQTKLSRQNKSFRTLQSFKVKNMSFEFESLLHGAETRIRESQKNEIEKLIKVINTSLLSKISSDNK